MATYCEFVHNGFYCFTNNADSEDPLFFVSKTPSSRTGPDSFECDTCEEDWMVGCERYVVNWAHRKTTPQDFDNILTHILCFLDRRGYKFVTTQEDLVKCEKAVYYSNNKNAGIPCFRSDTCQQMLNVQHYR